MMNFRLNQLALLLLPLIITPLSAQADVDLPGGTLTVRPPYKIKPNTPFSRPSGYSPAQMKKAYGFSSITAQGAGQVIGIIDAYDNPNAEADLGVFNSTFNLPACTTANGCFQKIYASGSKPQGNTDWGTEISLDIQWAHAIAPKAKIMLVEAANNSNNALFTAINVAIQKGATVISMSWGGNEFSNETQFDRFFNVPDVTFTASTGDNGHGLEYPSVSPYVIAVGGTTLRLDSSGNYLSETAWSGSGGGLSSYEAIPAYQSGFPIPNDPNRRRGVPDVSYNANPNTGVSVYDTFGRNGWLVLGGTSEGAPQFAALIAVAKSAASRPLTGVNSALYTLAKQNYSGLYHDITSGTNGSCGYYCTSRAGYDYVTGIGTPKASTLIPAISKIPS
jgi:subtilase family serine protease